TGGAQQLLAADEGVEVAVGRIDGGGLAGPEVKFADRDRIPLREPRRGDGQGAGEDKDPEGHRMNPERDGDPSRHEAWMALLGSRPQVNDGTCGADQMGSIDSIGSASILA